MLAIQNLSKSVKEKKILTGINITLKSGSILSLLGPSGSGKTTLLRIIMGLEHPEEGILSFGDMVLSKGKEIVVPAAQRDFAFVFQEFTLFPHLDVYKNIIVGLDHVDRSDRRGIADHRMIADRRSIAEELLELFEISHLKHQRIETLSGGEQQRVAIASSLAIRPKLLLLDEPFSNIDRRMKEQLYERLQKVLKQYNITTILATHDHGEAFFFSDTICVLKDGKLMDTNSPYLLYTNPADSWVASFIGDVNFITGHELKTVFKIHHDSLCDDTHYLIRPEEFHISGISDDKDALTIEKVEFYGFYTVVIAAMHNGKKIKIKDINHVHYTDGEKIALHITKKNESILLNAFDIEKEDKRQSP